MIKLKKTRNNIDYIEGIPFMKLIQITDNPFPICDECLKDLIGFNDIILIPILNEAYCKECGKEQLKRMKGYAEDMPIQKKRTAYYCKVLGVKENDSDN